MDKALLLHLRLQGLSYTAIGVQVGLSRQRIQQLLRPPTAIYNLIKQQARGHCAVCDIQVRSGHVHHQDSTNGDTYNVLENLIYLCPSCHKQAHSIPQHRETGDPIEAMKEPMAWLRMATETNRRSVNCLRCEHIWYPVVATPKVCPRCKSRLWNKAITA